MVLMMRVCDIFLMLGAFIMMLEGICASLIIAFES